MVQVWSFLGVLSLSFSDYVLTQICLFVNREQIIKQSTELVCRAYGEVYAAVMNPVNEYKDPGSILHRSPQQVQTLLSWSSPLSVVAEYCIPKTLKVFLVFSLFIITLKSDGCSFLCIIRMWIPVTALVTVMCK